MYPYLVWFSIRFFQNTLKCIKNTPTFLIFQRNNPSIFTKNIVTNNKNLNPLLSLLINCISAKSAPQILSLNAEYTFFFM